MRVLYAFIGAVILAGAVLYAVDFAVGTVLASIGV